MVETIVIEAKGLQVFSQFSTSCFTPIYNIHRCALFVCNVSNDQNTKCNEVTLDLTNVTVVANYDEWTCNWAPQLSCVLERSIKFSQLLIHDFHFILLVRSESLQLICTIMLNRKVRVVSSIKRKEWAMKFWFGYTLSFWTVISLVISNYQPC